MVIADNLKRDKDCLKMIDQQVEAKWENQRAFLASFVNLLTCNQRAERGEDQAHNLFVGVGNIKELEFSALKVLYHGAILIGKE